jgi:hypothetical protein
MEPMPLVDVEDTRAMDATHRSDGAKQALLRTSLLNSLTPFGRLTPFHR